MQRRSFIQGLVATLFVLPLHAFAAFANLVWNKQAFEATQVSKASNSFNITNEIATNDIELITPDRAENGAIVQVQVTSNIPNTEAIIILVEHNPTPLIANFTFSNGAEPFIITRIKMADNSAVKVVVKAENQYFTTSRNVEVLSNGCG